jgi:hypothetical protein
MAIADKMLVLLPLLLSMDRGMRKREDQHVVALEQV